jgi:myo-inositol 2-dehydrogenase/D-chiro-inositol 1-dehydrogenase
MTRYEKAYAMEMAAFVEAIQNKKDPPTTGDDGLKALIIAEAALKSVESGKKIQLNGLE